MKADDIPFGDGIELPPPLTDAELELLATAAETAPIPLRPAANGTVPIRSTLWDRINLADPQYASPPEPPWLLGLIYKRKRHLISGPPESVKTLISWVILLAAIREAATVAVVDFEMGPHATRLLLTELGATLAEIESVHYYEPGTPFTPDVLDTMVNAKIELVLIDALAGAYDVEGLDDNKRKDAEIWANLWSRPLYRAGISTLMTDHVVKNAENRGNFSIGSERKAGTVDIHLGLETIKPLSRGDHGLFKAHVKKDRPAYLRKGGVREIELHSDPVTHHITWEIRETAATADTDHWQPTVLMARVSEYLEQQTEPVSLATVERDVRGKARKFIRQAVDELAAGGYLVETQGPRNSRMFVSTHLFTTSPDLAPTSPGEVRSSSPHLAPPYKGGEVPGEVTGEVTFDDYLGEVNSNGDGHEHPPIDEGQAPDNPELEWWKT